MLTRSKQHGAVEVTGEGLRGRVFVGKRGIDLATTWGDEDLHRHLVNSGFTDESALRRILSAETTLAAIAESNNAMIELVREMTVESIFQIGDRGDEFEVHEGLTTPYASPKSFELESLLEDASQRGKDWNKVSEVVPDLATAITFRRDLGEREEVTVKVDDWKVLSEIGVGSSVSEIADHLGTTEFWTARVAARLVKNDLVVISDGAVPEVTPRVEDDWDTPAPAPSGVAAEYTPEDHTPSDDYTHSDDDYDFEEPVAEVEAEEAEAADDINTYEMADVHQVADDYEAIQPSEVAESEGDHGGVEMDEPEEDVDHSESWWQEPEDETDDADLTGAETPEVVSEGLSEIPGVDGDNSHVEEDTEAFLEKVFSELESSDSGSEPESESQEEGHGLLRRRRMGTLRDFSSDS
ncbi:MAG: hypothetical protein PVJ28_12430 [Acidimicrobiia bacterium]|jgi:hypothetical protein